MRLAPNLVALLVLASSCGRKAPVEVPPEEVIPVADARDARPPGMVHAYPPHAIRSDGVGPYLINEPMAKVLRDLPEGPHLELLQVGRYANWRIARAEQGAILVGADESNKVTFVSVVRAEVARTPSGIAVGASGEQLTAALGPADPPRARVIADERIVRFASLPGVHLLTSVPMNDAPADARLVGVVVTGAAKTPEPDSEPPCAAPAGADAELVAAARLKNSDRVILRSGCVASATGEAIVIGGGELALVGGEPGKLRRLASVQVGTVELAGALDLDGDKRDEIVLVSQRRTPGEHAVELRVLRWETGRLVEALVDRPFAISEGTAAAGGVSPDQIDLAMEVRAVRGGVQVGGFFAARRQGVLGELAPLLPVTVRVETKRPGQGAAAADVDAGGAVDGGVN